jgi:outer membrane protein W
MNTNLVLAVIVAVAVVPKASAQKGIEVTPFIGGQINGGLDLSTTVYNRLEVQNGLTYGATVSYAINKLASVEFMWNHNQADTLAQFSSGAADRKLFSITSNQYLGDFLMHFKDSESRLRPFVFVGAGIANLAPNRNGVNSTTRFAWVLGGGIKYSVSKHLGVRFQAKWSPTYINTFTEGVWCDPLWFGCWASANSVFLHEFDGTAGLTFRF